MNFPQVKTDWYLSTFLFYLFIIFAVYILSFSTTNMKIIGFRRKKYDVWSLLVGIILIFIKGFGTTGRDLRTGYYNCFIKATTWNNFPDNTVEPGYKLLNVIIRNLTDEYWIFVLIISLITILPVIHFLKKYKEKIDLPTALLMYCSIFFFNTFSPLRMCVAASLGLFAYDALVEKKTKKALVWIIVASTFHTSALILFVPFFFSQIKWMNKSIIFISLASLFLLAYIGRNSFTEMMVRNERYYIYQSFSTVDIGFEQFIYFIPLFFILFFGRKFDNKN